MNEISVPPLRTPELETSVKEGTSATPQGQSFGEVLKSAVNEVTRLQQEADQAITTLAAGKGENIHQTMIALEKASVSFQLMMQVRNKIVSAYEEIMRMQV